MQTRSQPFAAPPPSAAPPPGAPATAGPPWLWWLFLLGVLGCAFAGPACPWH